MAEALGHQRVQCALADVAEGSVTQVVSQGDGLGQILVQAQATRQRPRDLAHLQRVGQAGAVVVTLRGEEDLRLVLQAAKGLAMQNTVAVTLEISAHGAGLHRTLTAGGAGGEAGTRGEPIQLLLFKAFADGHAVTS